MADGDECVTCICMHNCVSVHSPICICKCICICICTAVPLRMNLMCCSGCASPLMFSFACGQQAARKHVHMQMCPTIIEALSFPLSHSLSTPLSRNPSPFYFSVTGHLMFSVFPTIFYFQYSQILFIYLQSSFSIQGRIVLTFKIRPLSQTSAVF